MDHWITTLVTVICSLVASGGFWAFLQKRANSKDVKRKLLLGIAHDRIMYLGMLHIERGKITRDEFEHLHKHLFVPYVELGGNGTAMRVMKEVEKLPIERRPFPKGGTNT